jgi:hypothetical protein
MSKLSDEDLTLNLVTWLCGRPELYQFMADQLIDEPSAKVRVQIVRSLRRHWQSHQNALELVVKRDSDAAVVIAAVEMLRWLRMREIQILFRDRLTSAIDKGDSALAARLKPEEERWTNLTSGTMLPGFMRQPPPVFTISSKKAVHFAAFGDFGNCTQDQKNVAAAVVSYHQKRRFDFGITLGDNFTPEGMYSLNDPRWKQCWEDLYGPMGITFYPSFGNHDWVHPDSPAAELIYKSSTWRMPAPYYSFIAGPIQFFVIDTEVISKAQADWLRASLDGSRARWKVVYGHHPPYLATPALSEDKVTSAELMPILKGRADVYLAGHYHSLQHLKAVDGVNLFISAGGGRPLYEVNQKSPVAVWAVKEFGFTAFSADEKHFKVTFIGTTGQVLYATVITK